LLPEHSEPSHYLLINRRNTFVTSNSRVVYVFI